MCNNYPANWHSLNEIDGFVDIWISTLKCNLSKSNVINIKYQVIFIWLHKQITNLLKATLHFCTSTYSVTALNPMAIKLKIVTNKTEQSNVNKLQVDVVIHDCSIRISKKQYDSMLSVADSMERMLISWCFLSYRPNQRISENRKIWWRYASYSLLEQRVKPYTWSRIRRSRENYRRYMHTYKEMLLNPNDTELKLELQKYEDDLPIINVVIARQQARLMVRSQTSEVGEYYFVSVLFFNNQ